MPKPGNAVPFVNFENVTFKVCREGSPKDRFKRVPKSPANNCYFGLPVSLDYKPSQADEEEMRLFLWTSQRPISCGL